MSVHSVPLLHVTSYIPYHGDPRHLDITFVKGRLYGVLMWHLWTILDFMVLLTSIWCLRWTLWPAGQAVPVQQYNGLMFHVVYLVFSLTFLEFWVFWASWSFSYILYDLFQNFGKGTSNPVLCWHLNGPFFITISCCKVEHLWIWIFDIKDNFMSCNFVNFFWSSTCFVRLAANVRQS